MKSRAHFKSHPIHPILIAFPIAFFTGALLFDVLGVLSEKNSFHETARYLAIAGIVSGLVAAVPGVIDLFSVVPPKSSGRKRGIKHGLLNSSVILIFALSLSLRDQTSMTAVMGLELGAFVLLSIAGFMGGTLVYRNQIGVDVRYAGAGKWKELHEKISNGKISITKPDVKENQMCLIHAEGKRIVVAKTSDGFTAFDDHCPHRGGSLAGGSMMCGTVQCPWHGSQFDVTNGSLKAGPAKEGIRAYQTEEENNVLHIFVR